MSTQDLSFAVVSTGDTIYDPLTISSSAIQVRVTNLGSDDLESLGLFIVPATNVGDVDNPADYPPYTDYQDILTWGTQSDLGLAVSGGLYVSCPTNDGTFSGYVTRTNGATLGTKIEFINLAAGDTQIFTLEMQTPPSVSARRFFIDLKLE